MLNWIGVYKAFLPREFSLSNFSGSSSISSFSARTVSEQTHTVGKVCGTLGPTLIL